MFRPLLFLAASAIAMFAADPFVSIAGEWTFRLDPDDRGIAEKWFASTLAVDRTTLPGSTDEHRIGARNGRRELRRLTRVYEVTGPVWYQRQVTIPAGWRDKQLRLFLERCHWETQVWLDDKPLGLQNSLST